MRRYLVGLTLGAALLVALSPPASTQAAELRVVQAAPNGEVNQLQDANEIRVIFSEPMVALGRVPSNPDAAVDPHHAGARRARIAGPARRC